MTSQEEMDDEDDWNPSKAAGVCMMLLSTLCEDDVLEYVSDIYCLLLFTFKSVKNIYFVY